MLQSKKKITGKAVLIFLICLTSVEGFIERTRQYGGEATTGETRLQQNQGSTHGDLKPSNDAMERRISQHIYDKRSFRTGSIAHRDTRTEDLLPSTKQNLREFRLQEDRRSTQPSYRLLNSRNYQDRITPSEDDTNRIIRDNLQRTSIRSSTIEERRSTEPSNNFERRISGFVRKSPSLERSSDKDMRSSTARNDNKRYPSDDTERRFQYSTKDLTEQSLERRALESRINSERSTDYTDRRIVDPEAETRQSRSTNNIGDRRSIEVVDHRHSSAVRVTDNNDRSQSLKNNQRNIDVTNANQIHKRTRSTIDRRLLGDRTRRYNFAEDQDAETDTRRTVSEDANPNQVSYLAREINERQLRNVRISNEDRSSRLKTFRDVSRQELSRRDVPLSRSVIRDHYRDTTRQNFDDRMTIRQETTSRLQNGPSEGTSRDLLMHRELEDNRFRVSSRQDRQSRFSMDLTRQSASSEGLAEYNEVREDRFKDIIQNRDSRIRSSRLGEEPHLTDKRNIQRSRSLEDTKLYREAPEDMLRSFRQSRSSRIELSRQNHEPSLIKRRNLQRSTSVEGSRLSNEIREDLSRNSRQSKSWMRDTRLNSADRKDSRRRMPFEVSRFPRDVREDRLSDARQSVNSRIDLSRQNHEPSLVERRNLQRSTSLEGSRLSDDTREDLSRNSSQDRDPRIQSWIQDARLNSADSRDSRRRMSVEDVREDRLSDGRQIRSSRRELSRQNKEPSLVDRRNLQRSASAEGSRLSNEIREDLFKNSRQERDSRITSWMRDSELNSADRRDSRRKMSFEDTRLSREAREDRLNDARQSRNSRIELSRQTLEPSLVERRNLHRGSSLEDSRLSDEIREDLSRNSRQGRDSRIKSWVQDTRFNSADRRDSRRRMSFEGTRLSRDVREDRLSAARQNRNSRVEFSRQNNDLNVVDSRDAGVSKGSREDRFRESRQREDSRLNFSGQARVTSLNDRRNLHSSKDPKTSRVTREDFRDSRQSWDSRIDVSKPNEKIRLMDRRDAQRSIPLENTIMSRESREDRFRESRQSRDATIEVSRQNQDRRSSQRSLDLSDYTRKIKNNPDYRRESMTDDRFDARTVRQNFENHFRQTRNIRYRMRENNRTYRLNDRYAVQEMPMYRHTSVRGQFLVQGMSQTRHFEMRCSERQYTRNIQSDDGRNNFKAISSGSDSPRRENKIANINFMTELNNATTTLGFRDATESLHQAYGHEVSYGVWVEALKLVLAAFLLGQIFVGSSDKYRLRIKNVISTLRLKKEKAQ